jgi:hypothetical protein
LRNQDSNAEEEDRYNDADKRKLHDFVHGVSVAILALFLRRIVVYELTAVLQHVPRKA